MIAWRSLLLVYPKIDVRRPGTLGFSKRFAHELPASEIKDAVDSFKCFPALVGDLTGGRAGIEYDIVTSRRALSTLSVLGDGDWWPSPDDTAPELEQFASSSQGAYTSIFVLWPQSNLQDGKSLKAGAWGRGMGPSPWSRCATYATVANAYPWMWQIPLAGEVWLHEWLHGVCYYYAQQGHPMPDGDADGADRHGYTRSPQTGWTSYYRDLMNGTVIENGRPTGIASSAWDAPFLYELVNNDAPG